MAEQKKSRKHGRNAAWCKAYRLSNQRERNKAENLLRQARRGRMNPDRAMAVLDQINGVPLRTYQTTKAALSGLCAVRETA